MMDVLFQQWNWEKKGGKGGVLQQELDKVSQEGPGSSVWARGGSTGDPSTWAQQNWEDVNSRNSRSSSQQYQIFFIEQENFQ